MLKEISFLSADRSAGGIQRALRDWAAVISENPAYALTLHVPDTPALRDIADELALRHRNLTTIDRLLFRAAPLTARLQKQTDLVFVHNGFLVAAARHLARHVVGVCHNDKPDKFRGADHLICLTPDGVDNARAKGWGADMVSCIPHFIPDTPGSAADLRDARPSKAPLHIISAGRLVAKKNFALFIKAAAIAKSARPDLQFTLAGTGPEGETLARLNTELGNPVSLIGWADLSKLAASADIFCSPSLDEPYGYVLTEMMQAGLAILASPSFGANLILDRGKTAPLLPFADATKWAEAILALDADRHALTKQKSAAMKRLQDPIFSRQRFADDINSLITNQIG